MQLTDIGSLVASCCLIKSPRIHPLTVDFSIRGNVGLLQWATGEAEEEFRKQVQPKGRDPLPVGMTIWLWLQVEYLDRWI